MQYESLEKIYYKDPRGYEKLYNSRITNEAAKKLKFSINGSQAFIVYCYEIVQLISKIYRTDKKIRDILTTGQEVPRVALDQFITSCLIEEIQITNEIEGVHSSHKEIVEVMDDAASANTKRRLHGLVQKYQLLKDTSHIIPLRNCRDVRKLYDEFIAGEVEVNDAADVPDGMIFRKSSVSIYSGTQKELHRGVNPESAIINAMEEALDLLNNKEVEPLVAMSIFHYMFGYIHPFYNGNGRMARFISSYILASNLHELTAFGFAVIVKKHIKDYYEGFRVTNSLFNKGDVTPFVIMMLEFVLEDENKIAAALEDKKEKLEFWCQKLKAKKYPSKETNLLFVLIQNDLFSTLELGVEELRTILKVSPGTVRKILADDPDGLIIAEPSKLQGRKKVYRIDLQKL